MRGLLLLAACALFLAMRAQSASGATAAAPAPLGERVVEHALPNGLKVIMLPNPKAPVVSFQVWYRVGARSEQLGRTGLTHVLEHMMFKGTERVGPEQFARIIQEHGGNNNAFTGSDFTAYFENMAAGEIGVAVELEADRMANLKLRPEDFETERMVVVEERRLRAEDNPQARLIEELDAAAYTAHPYGWPVIGWLNDLVKLTFQDVREHHQLYYRVNNAFLVVVGDFEPRKMLALIKRHFGKIRPGPAPPEVRASEPAQKGERRVRLKLPARLHTIAWGYHVPNLETSDDAYALEVLQAILTTGESSRLQERLVRKGLAVSASADYSLLSKDPGLFYLVAQVMPGKQPAEVAAALETEIRRLKEEPVAAEELAKAINQLEASLIRGQDSLFFQGMLLAMYENAVGWRKADDYLPAIRKVSGADIKAVATKYLRPENRTAALLIPTRPVGRPGPAPSPPASKVIR